MGKELLGDQTDETLVRMSNGLLMSGIQLLVIDRPLRAGSCEGGAVRDS